MVPPRIVTSNALMSRNNNRDDRYVQGMTPDPLNVVAGEVCLPSKDLAQDLAFFTKRLAFRLDTIFPADDPAVAVLSGHGLRLRLDRRADLAPAVLRLSCLDPDALGAGERELTAPNGVRIHIVDTAPLPPMPPTRHSFGVRRLNGDDPWVVGRAGMQYRDLVPGRLGGALIASHIRIPDAGPVPDMVHYHDIGFQLIFCIHGWVRLVYEDQGPPFVLRAGDCPIQPPRIRHCVLESSGNLEVVEVSVPAEHLTTIDHEMKLPRGFPSRPRVLRPEVLPERIGEGGLDTLETAGVRGARDGDRRGDGRGGVGADRPAEGRCSRSADQSHLRHPVYFRPVGIHDPSRRRGHHARAHRVRLLSDPSGDEDSPHPVFR
jgi:hypothetical protein